MEQRLREVALTAYENGGGLPPGWIMPPVRDEDADLEEEPSTPKSLLSRGTRSTSSSGNVPVEAAQAATRFNPHWRRRYIHLAMRRHRSIAKVAMGRRMAVRLYWMWRNGCDYSPSFEFGSYVGQLGNRHGGKYQHTVNMNEHPAPCKGSLKK